MIRNSQAINPSRRAFLRNLAATGLLMGGGAAGALALDLAKPTQLKGMPLGNHKRLVLVNLMGGADGLNMLIPKTQQRYYDRRPLLAVANGNELSLNLGVTPNSDYGMNPLMQNFHQLWQEGAMAVVNQCGYPNPNLSHFRSADIWSYGVRNSFSSLSLSPSGWISRLADAQLMTSTGVVSLRVGRTLDMVGGQVARPLVLNDLAGFKLVGESNPNFADNHAFQGKKVVELLNSSNFPQSNVNEAAALLRTGYDLAAGIQDAVATYNSSADYRSVDGAQTRVFDPALGLRDAAALIQAGFDTKVFYTGLGGWDHHSNQAPTFAKLLRWLDDAIGAFSQDLKDMGVWNETVVVIFSEFGRRTPENGSAGTDHGHGNIMLVLGGGVHGGFFGPEITNSDLDEDYLPKQVDFREVFAQLISNHLGADANVVFPEAYDVAGIGALL